MTLGHILVATDFSPHADAALDRALALAKHEGARLSILHVTAAPTVPILGDADSAAASELAAMGQQLENAITTELAARVGRARAAGVEPTSLRRDGHADEVIVEAATELDADLVVIGTHGRTGVTRFLLGSVAEHIVRRASCNVLVARGAAGSGVFQRALVATDFSDAAPAALSAARQVSEGPVEVVHAWQYPVGSWGMTLFGEHTQAVQTVRHALVATAEQRGAELVASLGPANRFSKVRIEQGPPASVVTDLAHREGHDLIVVGTHGHRGLRRFLLGSVAEAIIRHAHCSVLIAHPKPA